MRFVPLQHTSAASRCPGRPSHRTVPLRRFAACPGSVPRPSEKATLALAVFRASRVIKAVSLEPADVRVGSFDRRKPACCGGHSSIDRTRVPLSSIHRMGAIGETAVRTLTTDPASSSAAASNLAAPRGSCTDASFSAVFRYPSQGPSRPGRTCEASSLCRGKISFPCASLPARIRRRSWGSALRSFNPTVGWSRRTSAAAKSIATFLPDRAHVPFAPPRPPRFIFVGVIGRRLEINDQKGGRSGMRMASTSGLRSRLRSDRVAYLRPRGSFLPWAFPLAGFRAQMPCNRSRARPRSDHQPPGTHARDLARRAAAHPNPLMGFRRPSQQRCGAYSRIARQASHPCLHRILAVRFAVPSAY